MLTPESQIERVPIKHRDCNLIVDTTAGLRCRGLNEMFCVTKGTCKFYKSKKDEKEKDKSETYT